MLYLAPPRTASDRLTSYTFVDEEIQALTERGAEMFLLTDPLPGAPPDEEPFPAIHLRAVPPGKSLREFFATLAFLWRVRALVPAANWRQPLELYRTARVERFCAKLIKAEGIDLIHSNFGWPGGFGGVLAKTATGRPLVSTCRGMDVLLAPEIDYGLRRSPAYDRALRVLLRHADRTTHVSDFIRQAAVSLGAEAARARTVRKGVDCEHFNGLEPWAHGLGAAPLILVVAGLISRKGVDHILRALGLLKTSHDFRLAVIGEGPEREALEALCDELSLRSRTVFTGTVPRDIIPRWFAASAIFVLGSIWEASGNVLLEAMASGTPVVCTDSGGPPEYVLDGETGFVVPPADPAAMADRIRRLLDDPELRQRLGQQGRERAVGILPYDRMVETILGVYRAALGGGATQAGTAAAESSAA